MVLFLLLNYDVVMPKPQSCLLTRNRYKMWGFFLQFFVFSSRDGMKKKAHKVTEPCGNFDRSSLLMLATISHQPDQTKLGCCCKTPLHVWERGRLFYCSSIQLLVWISSLKSFHHFSPACELPSHSHMRQEIKWNDFYQNKNKSRLSETFQRVQ